MRTTIKNTVKLLAVTLALAITASVALAQSGTQHHGKGYGPGHPCPMSQGMGMHNSMGTGKQHGQKMMGQDCSWCMGAMKNLSAEQKKAFLDRTVELRRQMMEKHFNYREALRSGTDKKALDGLKKEMNELRAKIMQIRREVAGQ